MNAKRWLVCWLLAASACAPERANPGIVVLAAASLRESFHAIANDYDDARITASFAGSQTLATQLRAGFPADVVATADGEIARALEAEGLIDTPVRFAHNRLVWLLRKDAAVGMAGDLLDPQTVAHSDWRIVLAAPEVPAGAYAREALSLLGVLEPVEAHLVSQELDVKGVLAKLMLAGADAGMVYATDVADHHRAQLRVFHLPARADVRASYWVATTKTSRDPERAARFVSYLLGPGRGALEARGFMP